MRQPFSIHAFLYQVKNDDRRYLLLKRIAREKLGLPVFWQGVTGGMELNETFHETAKREVLEETGFNLDSLQDINFSYSFPIKDEWRASYGPGPDKIVERVFCAQVTGNPVLSKEHSEYGWFKADDALRLLTYGESRDALVAVERWLHSR